MKEKHAQKNFGAIGAMAPTPLSLKTPGGGGGLGGVAYKDRARPPPPPPVPQCTNVTLTLNPCLMQLQQNWYRIQVPSPPFV